MATVRLAPRAFTSAPAAPGLTWEDVRRRPALRLYAGDVPALPCYDGWVGLSLERADARHVRHDVTVPFPLPDASVAAFQSEDVFEHLAPERVGAVIDEIHRVLRPGGLFRLSLPDYGGDVLRARSELDAAGEVVFDPGGGGTRACPGHRWFPTLARVDALLARTRFAAQGRIALLQGWLPSRTAFVLGPIDHARGHVQRTPEHDARVRTPPRPLSLVFDLTKD